MEDFDYDIHETTPTESIIPTIIKEHKQTSKNIHYIAHKLAETGMPLSSELFSDDDEDIEYSQLDCVIYFFVYFIFLLSTSFSI